MRRDGLKIRQLVRTWWAALLFRIMTCGVQDDLPGGVVFVSPGPDQFCESPEVPGRGHGGGWVRLRLAAVRRRGFSRLWGW
jgi:hypothetical protein